MSNSPQAAANDAVLLSQQDGIAVLTLNRPDKLNSLNNDLARGLDDAVQNVMHDKDARVLIVTGAGRAFCAGGDLGLIGKGKEKNDPTELEPLLRAGMHAVFSMRALTILVIAAVNGPAAGAGMNVALAADFRIAAEEATFGQNFAKVGLYPDYGGTFFLPELAGPARAAQLFYTGEMIDAKTALAWGIVNQVVHGAELQAAAKKIATTIAQGPPFTIRNIKRLLFNEQKVKLQQALENELQQQLKAFASEDAGEGIRAFLEKRKPNFSGK